MPLAEICPVCCRTVVNADKAVATPWSVQYAYFHRACAERRGIKPQHRIVCLCGSTRFTDQMLIESWKLAKQGVIVLGWSVLPTNFDPNGAEITHHMAEREGVRDVLDELHMRKIDLADEVLVINVGGYIGSSTRNEINYALNRGKLVRYLEERKP